MLPQSEYSAQVLEYFFNPRNVGCLCCQQDDVGSAVVRTPSAADVLYLAMQINAECITKACFKAHGSVATIAIGAWLTEWLPGKSLSDAAALDGVSINDALALPPVKLYAAVLAEDAIKAAIADYQAKS